MDTEILNQNITTNDTPATDYAYGYQQATVCVPVTVTPYAHTGTTTTKLCGDTIVTPGATNCTGIKNGVCSFTISQIVGVAIPVEFGATATVGDTYINCLGASNEDMCKDTTV